MPAPPDLRTLFDTLRAWVDAYYPEHGDVTIRIEVPGHRPALILVPPACADNGRPEELLRHSSDWREVVWHGTRFRFSKAQAAVVETLHLARERGHPDVSQESLIRAAASEAVRLIDVFRRTSAAHAWNLLIVPGLSPGTFRLADRPPAAPSP